MIFSSPVSTSPTDILIKSYRYGRKKNYTWNDNSEPSVWSHKTRFLWNCSIMSVLVCNLYLFYSNFSPFRILFTSCFSSSSSFYLEKKESNVFLAISWQFWCGEILFIPTFGEDTKEFRWHKNVLPAKT
jgi:hypothetical protein